MNKIYTQSILRDYLSCPYKYKLKYKDDICWFQDDFRDSFRVGSDFHIIAERYFLDLNNDFIEDEQLLSWFENLKETMEIKKEWEYLPEYDIRYNEIGLKFLARYDLIILEEEYLTIVDWKTNKNRLTDKSEDIQTIVYMFLLANSLSLFKDKKYSFNQIRMKYWQSNYPKEVQEIHYSFEKHLKFKKVLMELIGEIKKNQFKKDVTHCNFCEFDSFCNSNSLKFK